MKDKRQKSMRDGFSELEQFNRYLDFFNNNFCRLKEMIKIKDEKVKEDLHANDVKKEQVKILRKFQTDSVKKTF